MIDDTQPLILRGEPKHARCYCVVTAAGVATVVGGVATAASAGYSAYQANKASKMAEGSAKDLYGSKINPTDYENTVNLPAFEALKGSSDYLAMLPQLRQIAGIETKAGINKRNKVMPGSSDIMSQAAANLIALSRGQVAPDVVDSTNRIIAERTGGAFDPTAPDAYAGGSSQAVAEFSRAIGRTSQQNVMDFLSAAPAWEKLADEFAYTPQEVAGTAMDLLKTRLNYELGKAGVDLNIDANRYKAGLNFERTIAAPNPQAVGAQNDMLLRKSIEGISGGAGNYITAINGIVSGLQGINSGYGQIKAANRTPAAQDWRTNAMGTAA